MPVRDSNSRGSRHNNACSSRFTEVVQSQKDQPRQELVLQRRHWQNLNKPIHKFNKPISRQRKIITILPLSL
jgi:hypothetical protein